MVYHFPCSNKPTCQPRLHKNMSWSPLKFDTISILGEKHRCQTSFVVDVGWCSANVFRFVANNLWESYSRLSYSATWPCLPPATHMLLDFRGSCCAIVLKLGFLDTTRIGEGNSDSEGMSIYIYKYHKQTWKAWNHCKFEMTVLDSTKVPLRCHIDVMLFAHAGNLIIFRSGPLRAQIVSPLQTRARKIPGWWLPENMKPAVLWDDLK